MTTHWTIGAVSKRVGLTPKTIRFYEEEGLLPRPRRTESGYRIYGEADLARLLLVRRARLLGLSLPATKSLVDRALAGNCAAFGEELIASIATQREAVARQIKELEALTVELDALEAHVQHCCAGCDPGAMATECSFCGLIEAEKGGENDEA
jgi:DNA-binding transcriptional MerR regulator